MKISSKQLEMALSKLRYDLLGYSKDKDELVITIELTQENPGNGVMTDCLTIKGIAPPTDKEGEGETSMTVEIYPESAKLEPRASKTKSFTVTSKY